MKLTEIAQHFPALRKLHGGTTIGFEAGLRRTAATTIGNRSRRTIGTGSGSRVDYQLWHLRTYALRIIINRLVPQAKLDDRDLHETRWTYDGHAIVKLDDNDQCSAHLDITIPAAIWAELITPTEMPHRNAPPKCPT